MPALFSTDDLFATVADTGLLDPSVHCVIHDREISGPVVALVKDRVGAAGKLVRAFGSPGTARHEWDVMDADGHRLLDVVKPKDSLRGASPEVSLANGTAVGRAVPTQRMSPRGPVDLIAGNGTVVGGLAYAVGERRSYPILMYRVLDESRTEVGEIARSTDPWGFHLSFNGRASVSVRALALAWTICLVQKRVSV